MNLIFSTIIITLLIFQDIIIKGRIDVFILIKDFFL